MLKIKFIALLLLCALALGACQTVSKKIDEKTTLEEKELNKWLNKSTFKKLHIYLKSLERHQDRLEKMKKCLEEKNIPFEEGDWQTIDKDCERNKLN